MAIAGASPQASSIAASATERSRQFAAPSARVSESVRTFWPASSKLGLAVM